MSHNSPTGRHVQCSHLNFLDPITKHKIRLTSLALDSFKVFLLGWTLQRMELNSNHVSCKFTCEVKHATSEVLVSLETSTKVAFCSLDFHLETKKTPRGF